jgi:hypothetical protein
MKPLPTHMPWSGGSTVNWLPPRAKRCWNRFRPSKPETKCGLDLALAVLAAAAPPLPLALDRLRAVIVPENGSGPASESISPGNSTLVTSPEPEGVKSPV